MRKVTEIPPTQDHRPTELRHLRVAAYCRVSTELEEQTSSIELQERHYSQLISGNPHWENARIFLERATGLNLKERPEFRRMIEKCRRKKIDLILTKSISRFGRNTLYMLRSLRDLRGLGVEVYFEQEDMWLNEQRIQILLTAYCALAQAESEDMSRNIKWGIKRGFERGTSGYAKFVCFGYKRGDDGRLVIDEPDAEIVRRMFEMRAAGYSLGTISNWLYENKIVSPTGKPHWSRETISKLLRNEKYVGDVLLQKTFVKDLFSGRQIKNKGEFDKFLIHEHHPAIVSRELFYAVNKSDLE
ncbi:recombinase family protein [Flintibacter muris]|uniref:recombinase family protein n=1 Tax=Flintibacter muris TaxID=2941327 RepID=UPI002040B08E|nr:recombinase family protein [Flintibacter muris]